MAKNATLTIVGILIIAAIPSQAAAQIGLVDDAAKAASNAAKAAKVAEAARAGRIAASMTDRAGRILGRLPSSAATRRAFGLGLSTAATDAFRATPSTAGRPRIYLGMTNSELTFVPENPQLGTVSELPKSTTLTEYVARVHAADRTLEAIDYVVETDAVSHVVRRVDRADRVFLANYGAKPWPVRSVGGQMWAAEVTPSLWLKISEETIEDVKHLIDLSFAPKDMRVASLFDEAADGESVAALRTAAESTKFKNIETAEDALAFVGEKRGQIVTLIGHVEDDHFVVQGLTEEKFRVPLASLIETAERKDVSLLLLGCDTATVAAAGAGIAGRVNSIALASQLRTALSATTYGDFLAALGTPANPLVLSTNVLGHARVIVGTRLRVEARGQRAGVVTVVTSPKLGQLQTNNAAQTFRGIPAWLDEAITAAMGLIMLVFMGAGAASIFGRSWSPLKTTALVTLAIVLLPITALKWLFEARAT
jgi:hypothetical protein